MVIKEVWCAAIGEDAAILHERSHENYRDQFTIASSCKIRSNRRSRPKLCSIAARRLEIV